jgi:DNA-binding NarL/FixJ family response regulator
LDAHIAGDGIRAACEITELASDTSVVMPAEYEDDFQLFAALEAGAAGYLLKDIDLGRVPDVLEAVLGGQWASPRTLVSRVVEEFNARGRALDLLVGRNPADRLTSREWEVLELMRKDYTTRQIADALFVSRATVRTHVSAIMRKLDVTDRAAAVGLIEHRSTPAT